MALLRDRTSASEKQQFQLLQICRLQDCRGQPKTHIIPRTFLLFFFFFSSRFMMYYFHVPILSMNPKYLHLPTSQRSSSELSKETLLEKDEHEYDVQLPPRKTWRPWALALVLQGVLITIYTIVYLTSIQKARQQVEDTYRIDCKFLRLFEK